MISPVIIVALCLLFFIPIIGYFMFIIIVGVGFKHLVTIHKAKRKVKKGFGLVRMHHPTGYPEYIIVKYDGKNFKPFGEGGGEYIYKKSCQYYNEYAIPTIDYNIGDADPRNPNTGLISVTSPSTLENLIVKAVRADTGMAGLMEWFKKNWISIAIFIAVLIGMFLFTLVHFYDGNMELARQVASHSVINLPTTGGQ